MCTLTIGIKRETLILTFNRDERLTRGAEIAPSLHTHHGYQYFAPQDGDTQGTWIGINLEGTICCLTNYYAANDIVAPQKAVSRGGIVPMALSAPDPVKLISSLPLNSNYNGFCLFVIKDETIHQMIWTGKEIITRKMDLRNQPSGWMMFSSSASREKQVLEKRQRVFDSWCDNGTEFDPYGLPIFNTHKFKEDSGASILMKRDDAQTKSITQITKPLGKTGRMARMAYWPDPQTALERYETISLGDVFVPNHAKELEA